VVREAAVAATDRLLRLPPAAALLAAALLTAATLGQAAILPEDRADVMYHAYDGGGLKVDGPLVLVRKAYKDKVSVWANYYVDMITSASIDVVATASEYTEERREKKVGADYLHGKTMMNFFYANSEENDYSADTFGFGISQDFFGDLTNLGISYSRGSDQVYRTGDENFEEDVDRQTFGVSLSQILTPNLLVNLSHEAITEEGFLQSAYRQVRYLDPDAARGFSYESAVHPRTKTSNATALRAMYYLPYRASLRGEFRRYSDTWGVSGWNAEVGYVHPLPKGITAEIRARYYSQGEADFYGDLFARANEQNFMSRDKELSSFTTVSVGGGASYEFQTPWLPLVDRGQLNLFVDWIRFDYDNFRDVTATGAAAGEEPAYGFDSLVIRAFISFWY
jgi:hypothetical protein